MEQDRDITGYREYLHINMQKNKKLAVMLNLAALVIVVIMIVPVLPSHIHIFKEDLKATTPYFIKLAITMVGMIAYPFLHEWVHGIFIKRFSHRKAQYGFTRMFAYAGSDYHFNKREYEIIALAPLVIWGVVLLVLGMILPSSWFWVYYAIQVINVSGAAGDVYMFIKMRQLPEDILICDTGVDMKIYIREQEAAGSEL